MAINKLTLKNFTVFDKLEIEFTDGINVLMGENGTGKTHIMKVLYSACQASRKEIAFNQKIVGVFRPDEMNIRRLIKRSPGAENSRIEIYSDLANIKTKFHSKTHKWNSETTGEANWEKQYNNLISTFIPAKEVISHAYNFEAAFKNGNIDFDETYVDIVASAKVNINKGLTPSSRKRYLDKLQEILTGTVTIENEKFYLKPGSQSKLEFSLVAEGIRKLALLWQLIKNGTLENGSILFWDEPEANINPQKIPVLVDILLELQKEGVQIFIATHDYILAKYFEVKRRENNKVMFFSLYKDSDGSIVHAKNEYFSRLTPNPIDEAYEKLYNEVVNRALEE